MKQLDNGVINYLNAHPEAQKIKAEVLKIVEPLIKKRVVYYKKRFPEMDIEDLHQEITILTLKAFENHKPNPKKFKEFGFFKFLNNRIFWGMSLIIVRNAKTIRFPNLKTFFSNHISHDPKLMENAGAGKADLSDVYLGYLSGSLT